MRPAIPAAVAVVVAVTTAAAGYGVEAASRPAVEPLGPEPVTVVMDVEHSRFVPESLRVRAGTRVRFVIRNDDPINHEFIVGPPEVHRRHSDGTEATHPPVDGEVSLPALERGVTSYTFADPGTVEFACHLPGHRDYGMRGEVEVVPGQ